MIREFKEFLRSIYKEQNEFYEASKYIYDEAQKQAIARDLLRLYNIESERLLLSEEIKSARIKDEGEQLKKALVPRRWRRFFRRKKNYAAQRLEAVVEGKVGAFFDGELPLDKVLEPSDTDERPAAEPAANTETDNAEGLRPEPGNAGSTDKPGQ